MKRIEAFENIDRTREFEEQGINGRVYWEYQYAQESGNELLDFNEGISNYDIAPILEACKTNNITEFTISSTFSDLITTLAEFDRLGCRMVGLTEVKARHTDYRTGKNAIIPAIKMSLA